MPPVLEAKPLAGVSRIRELWRDLGPRGRLLAGCVPLVAVAVACALLAGPVVRREVASRAEARGLSSEVGRVRFGLSGVWLFDVRLASKATLAVRARLDAVFVPYLGSELEVHGGSVALAGTPSDVRSALGSKSRAGGEAAGSGRRLAVRGISLSWSGLGHGVTAAQHAFGLSVERAGDVERLRVDLLKATARGARFEARDLDASFALAKGRRFSSAKARSFRLEAELATSSASAVEPPEEEPGDRRTVGMLPAVQELLRGAFPAGATVEIEEARARFAYEGETIGFGPSRVAVSRAADVVSLSVDAAEKPSAGATPLALRVVLPLVAGDPALELEGGPVSLGLLGIEERQMGLTRVRETTLEAHLKLTVGLAEGELRASGSGELSGLSLFRPELAPEELRNIRLSFRGAGTTSLDRRRVAIDDLELAFGQVRLTTSLHVDRTNGLRLLAKGGVPLASCDAMLSSLPPGLVGDVRGMALEGTFALSYDLDYDAQKPEAMRVGLEVKNDCRVKGVPTKLVPSRFKHPFAREVKGAAGETLILPSGPGAPGWASYSEISRYMEVAVLVCEDGGFYRHRGFDYRAIERAIKDDVRAGRFQRGASTISMQLAKNLYLGREKTLARKIQEALLTMLLEQELSKQELMELYLNIVELGPGIYGVGQAAEYYFKTTPRELTLGQGLYLASILPDPTRQHFNPDGTVTERWSQYLQKLMRIAHKIERITEEELEAGLAEQVAFRPAGDATQGGSTGEPVDPFAAPSDESIPPDRSGLDSADPDVTP